ncbi:transposase [Candidatus Nomurabacteria bacterium]|nr:transposase [Candidatus Nomurabacteria bacterium]
MNHRDYKEFANGSIAHIYNRGNNKGKIFFDEQDYKAFLFRLALALGFEQKELHNESLISMPYSRIRIESVQKNKFKINAFCLMPNHFHLLIEQCSNISISKLISKVCSSYSKYINKKYNRVGHTFQDCFKAVNIENNPQLMWASSYIHMNPVKDGLAKHPSKYKWSSYCDFAENRNLPITSTKLLIEAFGDTKNFIEQTLNFDVKETL